MSLPRLMVLTWALALLVPVAHASDPATSVNACPRYKAGSKGLPTVGEWRTHPAVADVNGDGHPDLAGNPRKGRGPRVFLGDGKGSWTKLSRGLVIPEFTCGVGVDFADVNSDGHVDLGVADHCQGLFVFLGDGTGQWKLGPLVVQGPRRGYEDLQFGDVNGDGHVDLAAVSTFREGIRVFLGDGAGNWQPAKLGLPFDGKGTDIKLGDINADGKLDVAATYVVGMRPAPEHMSRNVVWLSNGSDQLHASTPGVPRDGKFFGVALGDVNADGHMDMVLSSDEWPGRAPLLVYLGDGGRSWKLSSDGLPDAAFEGFYEGVELVDLNADGHTDLVGVSHRDAGIHVWLGDGQGHWSACSDTGLPGGRDDWRGWGLAVADLNHDGKLDLVAGFGRNHEGALEAWLHE